MQCVVLAFLLALTGAPTGPQDIDIAVGADAYYLKTTGSLKFDERPTRSDRLDLEEDLGHHHRDFHAGFHATVWTGPHRFLVGYERWRSTWTHSLAATTSFDGLDAIPPDEPVRHHVAIDRWKTRYDFRVARGEASELRVGLRVDHWLIEQLMDSPSVGMVDDHLGTLVVEPAVSGAIGPLPNVRLEAEVAGIYYRVKYHSVRTFEGQAVVRWSPRPYLGLTAGYRIGLQRFINIDWEQRNEVDLISSGPIASVEIVF
jgi:hypothetical protein